MANVLRFSNIKPLPRIDPRRGLVIAAAGAASPREAPLDAARDRLRDLLSGLRRELDVADAAAGRLRPIPAPSPSPTLQELVSRGKQALLAERQRARRLELEAIRRAADDLADAIAPFD